MPWVFGYVKSGIERSITRATINATTGKETHPTREER